MRAGSSPILLPAVYTCTDAGINPKSSLAAAGGSSNARQHGRQAAANFHGQQVGCGEHCGGMFLLGASRPHRVPKGGGLAAMRGSFRVTLVAVRQLRALPCLPCLQPVSILAPCLCNSTCCADHQVPACTPAAGAGPHAAARHVWDARRRRGSLSAAECVAGALACMCCQGPVPVAVSFDACCRLERGRMPPARAQPPPGRAGRRAPLRCAASPAAGAPTARATALGIGCGFGLGSAYQANQELFHSLLGVPSAAKK